MTDIYKTPESSLETEADNNSGMGIAIPAYLDYVARAGGT